MSNFQSESQHVRKGAEHGGIGRRHLLRAGLAAAPVVLAVSGRSAMAAVCPPGLSGPTMASLNPSGDGQTCIDSSHTHTASNSRLLGRSPGLWKPNPNGHTFQGPHPWPIAPFVSITTTQGETLGWDPGNYLAYKKIASDAPGFATGTKYKQIFAASFEDRSFSRILLDENGSAHWCLCAAYLNAAAMGGSYVMTVEQVLLLGNEGRLVPSGAVLTAGQINHFLSQTWA